MTDTYRKPYDVDIVIVGWNQWELTQACLESIAQTDGVTYRVTFVDNGGAGGHLAGLMSQYPDMQFVRLPFNHGYCRGANVGLALAMLSPSKYVLLLNNDTRVPDDKPYWLSRMVELLNVTPDAGAVGAVSDNVFGYQRREKAGADAMTQVPVLIGFCMLLRKDAIRKVGYLDERYEPGNFDDFDYSFRLTDAGYRLMVAESVFIHHAMHASHTEGMLDDLLQTNHKKFVQKWGAARSMRAGLGLPEAVTA